MIRTLFVPMTEHSLRKDPSDIFTSTLVVIRLIRNMLFVVIDCAGCSSTFTSQ